MVIFISADQCDLGYYANQSSQSCERCPSLESGILIPWDCKLCDSDPNTTSCLSKSSHSQPQRELYCVHLISIARTHQLTVLTFVHVKRVKVLFAASTRFLYFTCVIIYKCFMKFMIRESFVASFRAVSAWRILREWTTALY